MGFGTIHVEDLDEFVAECDRRGGIADPEVRADAGDFALRHDTPIDLTLDGFDSAYIDSQVALYRELSGREVDQERHEHTPIDVAESVAAANPYASRNPMQIAPHARTVLTAIIVADLPLGATVLDMGSGWGLSTEMFAFCGCDVTAVDINPDFVDLVAQRAANRGHSTTAHISRFEDFESDKEFDAVFFYESLHHAIRPWEALQAATASLKPGGKVIIAGEPIQDLWWPQWGLRLDMESVYCIRKFGWFESGWSADFLKRCFVRVGFELELLPGLGIGLSTVGVATRPDDNVSKATSSTLLPAPPPIDFATIPVSVLAAEVRDRAAARIQRTVFRGLRGYPARDNES